MWLSRQNKWLFRLSVGAALVALLAYWQLPHFWMWYYGNHPDHSHWLNYWSEMRTAVGSLGPRIMRPIRISSRLSPSLAELNRFIAVAKPLGPQQEIKPEDVVTIHGGDRAIWLGLETQTHYIEFSNGSNAPRVVCFNPKQHDVRWPEWDRAVGKWSKEEALAETLRIVKDLGWRFTVGTHQVYTKEFRLKNTQLKVTPFYQVRLYSTNRISSITAVFQVGETAPGRLVTWHAKNPED